MADDDLPPPDAPPPPLNALVSELVDSVYSVQKLTRLERVLTNALQVALTTIVGVVLSLAAKIGVFLGKSIADAENQNQPAFNELARVAINDMFGVDPGSLNAARGTGGNVAAADAIGNALFNAFSGQVRGATAGDAGLEPTDAPAKAFLSAMAQLSIEGWLEGWLVEALSLGQLETFGDLDDTISHVLGLGRASAAVHGPLVRHLIVEPLEWKINKDHRPALLSPSAVARQWARGQWDWPDVVEELARQGWSDERIDAIINEQRRFISVEDVGILAHRIDGATFDPKQYLADMGYESRDADALLLARSTRLLDQQERQLADAYVSAFVAGDIDEIKFTSGIDAIRLPPEDTDHYKRLGQLRRGLGVTPLSDGDAREAVKRGLMTFAWYRDYLRGRGFDREAIDVKELLLRAERDQAADAAKLRAAQERDRAVAKAAQDRERADRIAAKAIADALPAYAEVRRAYVRGFVPLERLQVAIATSHPGIDAGDAAALAADAEQDRTAYLEQQAAHAAALAADTDKGLPLATLEASVLRGITSLDAYDRELVRRKLTNEDRRILVALLRGRIDDQAAAVRAKAAADARARLTGVSLAEFERAVRLGVRTIQQLAEFLDRLDTPDIEKALILDLLRADQTTDQDARAKRAAADAAAAARSINLPLRRRAVLKGIRPREQYVQDLADAGVSLENRAIELGLLDVEIADAETARARAEQIEAERAARDAAAAEPSLTLAQTERAVKLGLLTPDDLRAYLTDRGYGPDDVDTLVASVVADIPDLRAGERLKAQATPTLRAKGLELAALERAVARGLRTLDDYRAELAARGLGDDDRALLAQLLAEKVAIDLDALRAKVTTAIATVDGGPTIAELEAAILDGSVESATLQRFLISAGVARDVALVYLRLTRTFGADAGENGAP